jgi:hypothetical protein
MRSIKKIKSAPIAAIVYVKGAGIGEILIYMSFRSPEG